jgi:Mg-chelatase subunit ChlD
VVAGLVAVLGAGATAALQAGTPSGGTAGDCGDGLRVLRVSAAPEIAPVLAAATGRGSDALLPAEACLAVEVTPRPAGEVMAALSSGRPADSHAWVPDSSSWLEEQPPEDRPSLARSPVVLALHRSTAEGLGWPGRPVDVATALTGQGARALRLGLSRLDGSAAARLGVLEVSRTLAQRPGGRAVLTRTLRSADASLPDQPEQLLARVAADQHLTVPVAEQVVWAHDAAPGPAEVVAAYSATTAMLDYPLVPLVEARQGDVDTVLAALTGAPWAQRVQAAGFRSADGAAGRELTSSETVDERAAVNAPVPASADVTAAVYRYSVATRGMRMLAVLDVSGSMARPVPGLEGNRMDLATAAAGRGLGLLGDENEIGLWVFSTDVTPTSDYRELVPIGPLATRSSGTSGREALAQALADVTYVPQGDTGLYDTVLAAVRHVRRGWDPERVNSVVLLTDGRNDDADGITLDQLLTSLRAEQGQRPVPVITVAYGPDTDVEALRRIGEITGGSVYVSKDPRRIGEVVQDALGRRA